MKCGGRRFRIEAGFSGEGPLLLVKFGKVPIHFRNLVLDAIGISRSFPLQKQAVQATFNLQQAFAHRRLGPFGRRFQIGVGEAALGFLGRGGVLGARPVQQNPERRGDGCNRAGRGQPCVFPKSG